MRCDPSATTSIARRSGAFVVQKFLRRQITKKYNQDHLKVNFGLGNHSIYGICKRHVGSFNPQDLNWTSYAPWAIVGEWIDLPSCMQLKQHQYCSVNTVLSDAIDGNTCSITQFNTIAPMILGWLCWKVWQHTWACAFLFNYFALHIMGSAYRKSSLSISWAKLWASSWRKWIKNRPSTKGSKGKYGWSHRKPKNNNTNNPSTLAHENTAKNQVL